MWQSFWYPSIIFNLFLDFRDKKEKNTPFWNFSRIKIIKTPHFSCFLGPRYIFLLHPFPVNFGTRMSPIYWTEWTARGTGMVFRLSKNMKFIFQNSLTCPNKTPLIIYQMKEQMKPEWNKKGFYHILSMSGVKGILVLKNG